jgi:hypothetical protein
VPPSYRRAHPAPRPRWQAFERQVSFDDVLRSPHRSDWLEADEQNRFDAANRSGFDPVEPGDGPRRDADPTALFTCLSELIFMAEQASHAHD